MSRLKPSCSKTIRILAIVGLQLVAGCTAESVARRASPAEPTIAANQAIPAREIEKFFSPVNWTKIRTLPYRFCVVASGTINDRRFHVTRIVQKFGDETLLPDAYRMFDTIRLDPSQIGSHIASSAMAYVVLYPRQLDGSLALVYAKQVDYDATRDAVAAEYMRTEKY